MAYQFFDALADSRNTDERGRLNLFHLLRNLTPAGQRDLSQEQQVKEASRGAAKEGFVAQAAGSQGQQQERARLYGQGTSPERIATEGVLAGTEAQQAQTAHQKMVTLHQQAFDEFLRGRGDQGGPLGYQATQQEKEAASVQGTRAAQTGIAQREATTGEQRAKTDEAYRQDLIKNQEDTSKRNAATDVLRSFPINPEQKAQFDMMLRELGYGGVAGAQPPESPAVKAARMLQEKEKSALVGKPTGSKKKASARDFLGPVVGPGASAAKSAVTPTLEKMYAPMIGTGAQAPFASGQPSYRTQSSTMGSEQPALDLEMVRKIIEQLKARQ